MKSRLSLLVLIWLAVAAVHASPISLRQAEQQAKKVYTSVSGQTNVQFQEISAQAGFQNLYIFVADNGKGYVVLSADDCSRPVLAYSVHNAFLLPLPTAVHQWLQGYDDEIARLKSNNTQSFVERKPSKGDYSTVGPLLTSTWGQIPLYNAQCPEYQETRYVTGCVATAMAQIMRYWRYPQVGVGQHSYEEVTFGTLSVDFSATNYDWDNMPNALTFASNEEQVNAVATLMYHCGVSVDMTYGISLSQTSTSNALSAFVDNFGYSAGMSQQLKYDYTDEQWNKMLRDQIDLGQPVLYNGNSNNGGHAFVLDGYDSENSFHINWGWLGDYDGYYTIGSLNPQGGGTGSNIDNDYNQNNMAIIGIVPPSTHLLASANKTELSRWGDTVTLWVRSSSESADEWTASVNADWLTLDVDSGEGSGKLSRIVVSVPHNKSNGPRSAQIIITQGGEQRIVELSQPDGTPSPASCYGKQDILVDSVSKIVCYGGELFVIRPETLGRFTAGYHVKSVKFRTEDAEMDGISFNGRNFRIKIYENGDFTPFSTSLSTSNINEVLGEEVYSQYYTATAAGLHEVLLTTPYEIKTDRTFWIAVECLNATVFGIEKRYLSNPMPMAQFPLIDSLSFDYIIFMANDQPALLSIPAGFDFNEEDSTVMQFSFFPEFSFCTGEDALPTYEISVLSADSIGTVSGSGTYELGSEVTITATPPNASIMFLQWNDGNTDNPRTITVTSDAVYTAYWTFNYNNVYDTSYVKSCEEYFWRDTNYTSSGTYFSSVKDAVGEGLDSVYVLVLDLGHDVSDTVERSGCGEVTYHGITTDSSTFYMEATYPSVYGCDSNVYVNITVFPAYPDIHDTVVACDSVRYLRNIYRADKVVTAVLRSIDGCDSLVHHHFIVNKTSYGTCDSTVCDSLVWGGRTYTSTNSRARVVIVNEAGCDSIITVNLIVKPSTNNDTATAVCDSFLWYGDYYSATGRYYHPIGINDTGCNINIALNLSVSYSSQRDTFVTACDSFLWDGVFLMISGIYPQPLPVHNAVGCDSSFTLNLTLSYTTMGDTVADVCDSIIWYGLNLVNDTTVTTTIENSYGCDSLLTIDLRVRRSSFDEVHATASGFYLWHGLSITREGDTYDTLDNAVGCDSVVVLHLTLVAQSDGALSGVFAVGDGVQVSFSAGNLQYRPSTQTWRFAHYQYEMCGTANASASAEYMGWLDLFGWGTSGYHNKRDNHNVHYLPYSTEPSSIAEDNEHGYGPSTSIVNPDLDGVSSNYDWGIYCTIENGGEYPGRWRTLTDEEWQYLFYYRKDAVIKRAMAIVSGTPGLVLLPESWILPAGLLYVAGSNRGYATNGYSSSEWARMEAAGAVFLPAAGARYDTIVKTAEQNGFYWTSRHYDAGNAYAAMIEKSRVSTEPLDRSVGRSVRLVQDVNGATPCATYGDTCMTVLDSLTWFGTTYHESGDYSYRLAHANQAGCDSTVVLHLTVNSGVGINSVFKGDFKVSASARNVVISAAEGLPVRIYDVTGRLIASETRVSSSRASYTVPAAGVYMVKVGEHGARKVIVTE